MPFVVKCCPVMKQWNCCCCSCDLRSAAVIVGWIYTVYSTIGVLITVISLSTCGGEWSWSDVLCECIWLHLEFYYSGTFGCPLLIASVLLYAVLLRGVHKKKPAYMLPWLGCGLISVIFFLVLGTVRCIQVVMDFQGYESIYIALFTVSYAVEVFVWIVGYSYYRQLTDEKTSVSV